MAFDGYTGKAPRQWQSYSPQIDTSSLCGRAAQPAQFHEWTNCSRDLGAEIAARASHPIEFSQPLFGHPQPTIFDTAPPPGEEAYDTAGNCSPNALSLGAAFDGYHGKYPIEEGFGSDEMGPNVATAGRLYLSDGFIGQLPSDDDPEGYQATHSISKNRNRRQRRVKIERPETVSSRKPHRCFQCGYACERLEHLRRHKDSVHRPTMLPCAFQECKDTKADKHREIQSRFDNLKAHYTKTHFKYGSSEKGGKNERKSMKAAHGMGLSIYDHRWTLLLGDKMNLHVEIKDFLHVWKMLGYSIRETRDTKVKDVRPDWQVSDDQTLQKYDPRWKGLWNGTLTFDKAMSRGKDMSESEAEGLLGVTMLETEAMDIRDLDPRWTAMLDGRMSVELSEKLGVKQRNPLWKNLGPGRRAR